MAGNLKGGEGEVKGRKIQESDEDRWVGRGRWEEVRPTDEPMKEK